MNAGHYSIAVHPEAAFKVKTAGLLKRSLKEVHALGGDYAAGKLVVEDAGGKVTAFRGEKVSLNLPGCDILCSNGAIHRELMPLL
ncbi:MAG: hypothetical protein SOY73_00635 [Blautia sp.]|nr:hypothetical protein [Blautia sp.]MDY3997617.1 hypothetical protein [Blautia sp.]